MKICFYVQSANRPEYLDQTLANIDKLDFGSHDVDKICIDDYPRDRSPFIKELFDRYGFHDQHFHKTNWGVTRTWGHFWNLIKHKGYDYVFHLEDDSVFQREISIDYLIQVLNENPDLSQITFKRQDWYNDGADDRESKDGLPIKPDDQILSDFRLERGDRFFLTAACFYPGWITQIPLMSYQGSNPGEGAVAYFMKHHHNMVSGKLKGLEGEHLIEHVGEVFHGTRTQPNDPGYKNHHMYKEGHRYCSRTGAYLGKES